MSMSDAKGERVYGISDLAKLLGWQRQTTYRWARRIDPIWWQFSATGKVRTVTAENLEQVLSMMRERRTAAEGGRSNLRQRRKSPCPTA